MREVAAIARAASLIRLKSWDHRGDTVALPGLPGLLRAVGRVFEMPTVIYVNLYSVKMSHWVIACSEYVQYGCCAVKHAWACHVACMAKSTATPTPAAHLAALAFRCCSTAWYTRVVVFVFGWLRGLKHARTWHTARVGRRILPSTARVCSAARGDSPRHVTCSLALVG